MEKEILKDETLAEKLMKRWFWLYIFSFLIAPSGYIAKLLISNDLSVEEVWVIYWIIWLIWILSAYNDLWFTESLKYFLPKFWIEKKYNEFKTSLFLAIFFQTITAILIALALYFWADWLGMYYFKSDLAVEVLKIFTIFFVAYNIFRTVITIFESFQDTFAYKFVEFLRMRSVVIFCCIIFFSHTWNVLNYSLAWLWWSLIALLASFIIFWKKYFFVLKKWKIVFDKELFKKIISYAWWVVLASQAWILLWQIDLQMIIYFLWSKYAGYYTNYLSLLSIYGLILAPIFNFLFPITTELSAKKQNWKLSLLVNIFVKYFVVIWWYFWVFLAIFGWWIAFVLFWEKFVPSGNLLIWSWWFIFFNILIQILFPILAGLGKIKERVKILWFAALINFILNLILIPKFHLVWAIFSTIISWIIIVLLAYKVIKKEKINVKFDFKFYTKNFVFLFLFAILAVFLSQNLVFDSRIKVLILLLLVWLILFVWALFLNFKELKLFIKQVKALRK